MIESILGYDDCAVEGVLSWTIVYHLLLGSVMMSQSGIKRFLIHVADILITRGFIMRFFLI